MSFYLPRFYDGIEHVDATWPDAGATIVLRYRFGPFPLLIRQSVTRHDPGHLISIEEAVFGGVWTDHNEIILRETADGTAITVVSDQTSPYWPLRWLAPLRWLTNWLDIAPALRRCAAMLEAE
jgi:hypothetical protein